MLRARHALLLSGDVIGYVYVNRVWCVIPMMLLLAVAALLIVVGQVAAPLTLYTMF